MANVISAHPREHLSELYPRAFPPYGRIDQQGVRTRSGAVFLESGGGLLRFHGGEGATSAIGAGPYPGFFPLLDPVAEPATWTLALVELAEALGLVRAERTGLRLDAPDNYGDAWDLSYHPALEGRPNVTDVNWRDLPGVLYGDPTAVPMGLYSVPLTQDPVEALLRALVALRGRPS